MPKEVSEDNSTTVRIPQEILDKIEEFRRSKHFKKIPTRSGIVVSILTAAFDDKNFLELITS